MQGIVRMVLVLDMDRVQDKQAVEGVEPAYIQIQGAEVQAQEGQAIHTQVRCLSVFSACDRCLWCIYRRDLRTVLACARRVRAGGT